jgi:hypothetical protein
VGNLKRNLKNTVAVPVAYGQPEGTLKRGHLKYRKSNLKRKT